MIFRLACFLALCGADLYCIFTYIRKSSFFLLTPSSFARLLPFIVFVILLVLATAVINFINFLDGIDGLVSICMIVSIFSVSLLFQLLAFLVSFGIDGFLIWNWSPAKVFMGDVGSTFLGAVFIGFVLQASSWIHAFSYCYLLHHY